MCGKMSCLLSAMIKSFFKRIAKFITWWLHFCDLLEVFIYPFQLIVYYFYFLPSQKQLSICLLVVQNHFMTVCQINVYTRSARIFLNRLLVSGFHLLHFITMQFHAFFFIVAALYLIVLKKDCIHIYWSYFKWRFL